MPRLINHLEEYEFSQDVVAIGGNLDTPTLLEAYRLGMFPWPEDDNYPLLWFSPNPRGILRYSSLHISRSLQRTLNRNKFQIRFDTAFEQVISFCASIRRVGQQGTWITPNMKAAYIQLHREGIAHSVEAYAGNQLVGGLYGIYLDNTFNGESMFHFQSDASKTALVTLLNALHFAGIDWIDTQMLTPTVEALGGELVSKKRYLQMLKQNHSQKHIPWSDIRNAI